MMFIGALLKAIGRSLVNWLDPVCQNKEAALYGDHAGMKVRLVPVIEPSGHVKEWIPDPKEAAMAERIAADRAQQMQSAVAALPLTPAGTPLPFDPAGVPGL